MKAYQDLVKHVLLRGTRKENRTGIDTISTFGYFYEHDLANGFPLLTTKSIEWKHIVAELIWFVSGSKNIEFLHKHGCRFWDPWADESGFIESSYGFYWRKFPVHKKDGTVGTNDQLQWVVDELKRNPTSRRCVVSAWAPENAQSSRLPPCHSMFVLNVQHNEPYRVDRATTVRSTAPRLCLHLTQRSCDVGLGVPYNLASYALLIHILSRLTGIEPGIFGHSLVDAHIYTSKPNGSVKEFDHVPGLLEQINRAPRTLPSINVSDSIRSLSDIESLAHENVSTQELLELFKLTNYDPHPKIRLKAAI